MRLASLVTLALLVPAIAAAQPGQYGQPPPYPPPPYAAPTPYQVALTTEEIALLQRGEISDGQMLGGAAVNFFFGFGLGQAVQGRFGETGWMFMLGELGFGTLMVYGMIDLLTCDRGRSGTFEECNDGDESGAAASVVVGLIGYTVTHVWSIADAFAGPGAHNRRVRAVRAKAGFGFGVQPYLAPAASGSMVGGLTLRF